MELSSDTSTEQRHTADPTGLVVDTRNFELQYEQLRINCRLDTPPGQVAGRCILVPPFGFSILDLNVAAYYLLLNSFEVLRFDPTNHAGTSQGKMADFTLSGLVSELETVIEQSENSDAAVISFSITTRAAFRALRNRAVRGFIALSPVVNLRETLAIATGKDQIGLYRDHAAPPVYQLIGFDINSDDFTRDCIEHEFEDLDGTVRDAAQLKAPTSLIVGTNDRSLKVADVERVAESIETHRLVTLPGANHQLFRSPIVQNVYFTALLEELHALFGREQRPVIPMFKDIIRFVQAIRGGV